MRSPENLIGGAAPLRPLLAKELRDLFTGRALWMLLLTQSPLVGYSFIQAVSLYADASRSAGQFPELARSLSPFEGVVVPTFGALYLAATLLFPFIAIRAIAAEKQDGGLKLLLQLPYRTSMVIGAKLAALFVAWALVLVPCLSALVIWQTLGGHLGIGETLNLLLGHWLYAFTISGIALFAASVTDGSATAAIVALAFTIGFWVLDFAAAGQGGLVQDAAALSLTVVLRNFEQGVFSLAVLAGTAAAIAGLLALAGIWLPPGLTIRRKLVWSLLAVALTAATMFAAGQIRVYVDMTEDRRNSFSLADTDALARLFRPLTITVNLAPEDPRFVDLDRSLLGKLARTMPDVRIVVASSFSLSHAGDEAYGLITYDYGGRQASSRSTSPEEVMPLIYGLAGVDPPKNNAAEDYPGYPLVTEARGSAIWFYVALPVLTIIGWIIQSGSLRRVRRGFGHT